MKKYSGVSYFSESVYGCICPCFFRLSKRFKESCNCNDWILADDLKAEIEAEFLGLSVPWQRVSTALRQLFPSVKYTVCQQNNDTLMCFSNLRRKKPEIDLRNEISDELISSAGFSVVNRTPNKIIVTISTKYSMDYVRIYKELAMPFNAKNTNSISLNVFGLTVSLSKIHEQPKLNLNDPDDLITVLNQVKKAHLCPGYKAGM